MPLDRTGPPEVAAAGTAGPRERVFPIEQRTDALFARQRAQDLARELGFGTRRSTEIAIAVSELATNIVKYGIRGEVALIADPQGGRPGEIRIVARDIGPPIRNLELALQDGCDDTGPIDPTLVLHRGGLGTGLGAVLRFADLFEYQQNESGKAITVTFYRESTLRTRT
jgi:anti-sigma regulatory factor (Ser/Thr protein kinase)